MIVIKWIDNTLLKYSFCGINPVNGLKSLALEMKCRPLCCLSTLHIYITRGENLVLWDVISEVNFVQLLFQKKNSEGDKLFEVASDTCRLL